MLEVMGIRTGIQEEEESSSDEEERAWLRSGRLGPVGGRWNNQSPITQYRQRRWSRSNPFPNSNPNAAPQTIVASHGRSSSINASSSVFDAGSSDSEGNEVLPMIRGVGRYNHHHQTSHQGIPPSQTFPPDPRRGNSANINTGGGRGLIPSSSSGSLRQAGEAWFHAIDERYLLPLFSNAVASRTFHAKKASRRATLPQPSAGGVSPYEDSEFDSVPGSPMEAGASRLPGVGRNGTESPVGSLFDEGGMRGAVKRKNQEVFRSIGSFWRGPGRGEEPPLRGPEGSGNLGDGAIRGGGTLPGPSGQGS
jgi:sodium/hydrogen exchanger-like protein 6/7